MCCCKCGVTSIYKGGEIPPYLLKERCEIMYNNLQKIGEICKDKRQGKGLTQKEVADALSYSQGNISLFESGKNNNIMILQYYMAEMGVTRNDVTGNTKS